MEEIAALRADPPPPPPSHLAPPAAYKMIATQSSTIEDLKARAEVSRAQIGGLATPDFIVCTPGLPKTRSGKIMRRVLRKIACRESDQLGDTSTLADPSIVTALIDKVEALYNAAKK